MAISERKRSFDSQDYFPVLPDCWEISRIPLPENYTLMAALVLPETNEVIGAAKDVTETLFLMRYDLSGQQKIQFTRLYSESGQKINRCSISRNYIAAVINNTTIKVWDLKARLIDCQENKRSNTAIAFLDIHQLICLQDDAFTIRNVEEQKSTEPSKRTFLTDFIKLVITQNKYIVISYKTNTIIYKPGQQAHVAFLTGQFLCETPTELILTQCQQQNIYFNRYDKNTFTRNKDVRVPLFEQGRHSNPAAIPLPMGWINLITTYRKPAKEATTYLFTRHSTILNQAFEPISQKELCQSTSINFPFEQHSSFKDCDLVNLQSTIPASITANGYMLGHLRNYCLRWQKDPLHTQTPASVAQLLETFLRKDPASIVLEYSPLSCLVSPEEENQLTYQSISKDSLKEFLLHILKQLNHSADFANTKMAKPTLHKPLNPYGSLKNKLLLTLNLALEELPGSKDTLVVEQQMVSSINVFWKELSQNATINPCYLNAFNALMLEEMFNTPEKSEKLTVTKLRYIVLRHAESAVKHTVS